MDEYIPASSSLSTWVDVLIVIGAMFLAGCLAFIWFAFFHKQKRKRKHRRHRRERRPINPTLAQTGGLPPIREENPPQN